MPVASGRDDSRGGHRANPWNGSQQHNLGISSTFKQDAFVVPEDAQMQERPSGCTGSSTPRWRLQECSDGLRPAPPLQTSRRSQSLERSRCRTPPAAPRSMLLSWVLCRTTMSRARWRNRTPCCSSVLIATKAHRRARDSFTDCFGIDGVRLAAFDIGLHIHCWHQPDFMAEPSGIAAPNGGSIHKLPCR